MPRGGRPRTKGPRPGGSRAANEAAAARRDTDRRASLPRRTAYDVLNAVRGREAYANLLLPKLLADRQLTGRDAAFATELAYGTLRGQGTYDAVLAACSDRPLEKLDPPVLDVLRLGAHQLLSTRVGAHAAVATSVDLAKSVAGPRVSGYVNAVLRRVATRDLDSWLAIAAPDPAADADGYLAVRYSHPRWIVAAYRTALGGAAGAPSRATAAFRAEPEPAAPLTSPGPGDGRPSNSDNPGARASATGTLRAAARDGVAGAAAARRATAGEEGEGNAPGAETTGEAAVTELEVALAAGNVRPKVTLATFPSGPPREEVMPADAEPGRWSPYAFTLDSGDPAPLIASGMAAVQDEGSQLAAIALSRAPLRGTGGSEAEVWLDMCAGPGGKSRMLYGLAGSRAELIAADLHPHRAVLVKQALANAATPALMPNANEAAPSAPTGQEASRPDERSYAVLVADGTKGPWPEGTFDRILLDAPCSGLGALRRRPEARWRKSQADLKELTALQRGLLRSALHAVRPGGVVAYVTCSPVPAETSDVVADVTASMPGTEVLDTPQVLHDLPDVAAPNPRFAQLWPHRHGTDAIFIALLRRTAQV